ncbi:MAG: hypothetical protein J3K34DRAFT_521754 [Monoraphidium minutum]|nr:MAG: hypothetical protein J3K34DRAFT_521754 [Monoraphidium minutum]
MGRPGAGAWLAGLLLATTCLLALSVPERKLGRMDAKKWHTEAKKKAASAAKTFLEEAGQALMVPVDVEVFLIGFDGDGGYAHKADSNDLLNLLNAGSNHHCPHSLESAEELGVCFQVNYQVMGQDYLGDEATQLLRDIEAYLKANMRDPFEEQPWLRPRGRGMPQELAPAASEYVVDAAGLEGMIDKFLDYAYGERDPDEKGHKWHEHNPIVVINPSKVRINPKGAPEDQQHKVPDFFFEWHSHTYKPEQLVKEEANMTYLYSYNGAGSSAAWMSSGNFLVIDVAAGPAIYGPAVDKKGGVVGPNSFPALRDVYRSIFDDLQHIGHQLSAQEHAQVIGEHAQKALFDGSLAATVSSAARSLFIPDVATEHIEYARSVLVPVVLLTDYELTEHEYANSMSQENFMHINLTHVEGAVGRLLDETQEAVVVSAHHPLSRHKAIAAALWKARVTVTEQALEQGDGKTARVGMHTLSHSAVDPALLMEELAIAADGLTHGLVSAAHAMSKTDSHPLEQMRHDGTRVVPVFVLSLMKAPDDIMFTNREMVAASHDVVIVLQLRQSAQWGGTKDNYFTGHTSSGRRVNADGRDVTRHIVAGLAQALAGVVPPYQRPSPPGPPRGPPQQDWRWAVGATPFGPYSNFSGVSEMIQNVARRNLLLTHVSAALRAAQHRLDDLDAFVADHFEGPWAAAGVGGGRAEGRRHFLDTVVDTRHGFQTALTPDAVALLEGHMAALTQGLEGLAVDLYSHDFTTADTVIERDLLPTAAKLCAGLDAALEQAEGVMACCAARHVSALGRAIRVTIAAAAAFTAVFTAAIALAVMSGRRRRSLTELGLPTYGMSQYAPPSRPGSGLSFASRPASRAQSWGL